jgi:glycosyltransferase involved in cell wall biosynthesis
MPKLIRVTTVPLALRYLLTGQMRYMKEHGMEVIMISADGKGREELIQHESCEHYIIPMTRKITPFADLRSLWRLYRYFKKEKPDIVHSHTPKAGLLAMLAAKMAGVNIRIHTIAGLRFMTSSGISREILVAMEKLTARWATQVWPNSFSLFEYIKKNKLVTPKKMEVIGSGSSNGINLSRFSLSALQEEKLMEIKKLVGFDERLTYLLSVGRIVKDKGIDELLNAFVKAYENNKQLRLILVGPFEDELDPVSNETREILRSHPAVILTGWSEDVEYFMSFSFALVHPSHREGFPNVLLQAGAMLCPVICSRIEGNVDIIENEKTGLLFEPENSGDLLLQLEKALDNAQSLRMYSTQLRKNIEQYFDQAVVHDLIEKQYRKLLNKSNT